MASEGADYKFYDESFRQHRASMINPYPWSTFRADTRVKASLLPCDREVMPMTYTSSGIPILNDNNGRFNSRNRAGYGNSDYKAKSQYGYQSDKQKIPNHLRVPKGLCFAYNTPGKRCNLTNCRYKHICSCGRKHPVFMCRAKSTGTVQNQQPRSGYSSSS